MSSKNTVGLEGVSHTSLLTLVARARARRHLPELGFADPVAEEMVATLDLDEDYYADALPKLMGMVSPVWRAAWFDQRTVDFFQKHPDGLCLSLAAGLSSAFYRVSATLPEGRFQWVDVDLPPVIAAKRKLMEASSRYHMLAGDVTDADWLDSVERAVGPLTGRAVMVIVEGLLLYLPEEQVRTLFRNFAERFGARASHMEILFDYVSPLIIRFARPTLPGATPVFGLRRAADVRAFHPGFQALEEATMPVSFGFRYGAPVLALVDGLYRLVTGGRLPAGCARMGFEK